MTIDPTAKLRSFLAEEDLRIARLIEVLGARYVETDRDDVVSRAIKRLHRSACKRRFPKLPDGPDNRKNGVGFAVISESGAGKSTIIERVIRNYPAFAGFDVVGSGCPIIVVEAPSPCTLGQLALLIMEKLGYVPERDLRENVAWKRARALLKKAGIFFIWIDEAGNVLHQKGADEIRKVADTFRALMLRRDWPIQVILSGVSEVEDLLAIDRQLRRRVQCIAFPAIELPRDAELVEAAIADYAYAANLPVDLASDDAIVPRLCHAAVYQFGLVMEIIIEAIETCLLDGHDLLTVRDFANAYTGRTMQPVDQNPFLASAWHTVNCSVIRKKLVEQSAPGQHKGRGK